MYEQAYASVDRTYIVLPSDMVHSVLCHSVCGRGGTMMKCDHCTHRATRRVEKYNIHLCDIHFKWHVQRCKEQRLRDTHMLNKGLTKGVKQ